jgi:hypothetical protein
MEKKDSNYFGEAKAKLNTITSGSFPLNAGAFSNFSGLTSSNYTHISNSYTKVGNVVNVSVNWTMVLSDVVDPSEPTDRNITLVDLSSLFNTTGCLPKNHSTRVPVLTSSASSRYTHNSPSYVISSHASLEPSIQLGVAFYVMLSAEQLSSTEQTVICSMTGVIELACD